MRLRVVSDDGDTLRLQVSGRVVQEDLLANGDPMPGLLGERGYARPVLVGMAEADYIDSSGLAMLLAWHRRFAEAGGKLVLHSIPLQVMETLKILRMELVLNLAKDESAALAIARGESP